MAVTETILEEAQRLVHGDRGAAYGHPEDDYKATGEIWGAILERAKWTGGPVDPRIACLMMCGVKVSREAGKHKRDNLTDLAGYAECADMIAQRQASRVEPTKEPVWCEHGRTVAHNIDSFTRCDPRVREIFKREPPCRY